MSRKDGHVSVGQMLKRSFAREECPPRHAGKTRGCLDLDKPLALTASLLDGPRGGDLSPSAEERGKRKEGRGKREEDRAGRPVSRNQ